MAEKEKDMPKEEKKKEKGILKFYPYIPKIIVEKFKAKFSQVHWKKVVAPESKTTFFSLNRSSGNVSKSLKGYYALKFVNFNFSTAVKA